MNDMMESLNYGNFKMNIQVWKVMEMLNSEE